MKSYTVIYDNGKMIVTHSTGIVNKYDKKDILLQRHAIELDLLAAQDELKYFDDVISKIDKSVTKQPLLTRLRKLVTRKE